MYWISSSTAWQSIARKHAAAWHGGGIERLSGTMEWIDLVARRGGVVTTRWRGGWTFHEG